MRPVPRTDTSDAEFNQFLAELWDSLDAPIPGKWRTFDMTGRALEVPYGPMERVTEELDVGDGGRKPDSYLRPAYERSMLRSAIRGGMMNENLLANLVFFDRHPERNGRPVSREGDGANFQKLSMEWLDIRDTLVRPMLRGITPGQPAPGETDGIGKGDCYSDRRCSGKILARKVKHCHNCYNYFSGKSLLHPNGVCETC